MRKRRGRSLITCVLIVYSYTRLKIAVTGERTKKKRTGPQQIWTMAYTTSLQRIEYGVGVMREKLPFM